jgi:pyrroline-5-carboxylate reductase
MNYHFGFIGGGNMATALLRGLLDRGLCLPTQIIVSDVSAERRAFLANESGVDVTENNADVTRGSETLILAIKPQVLGQVAPVIAAALSPGQTVLSILAGVTTAILRERLNGHARIVRTMPNLPATLGKGVTGIAISPPTPEDAYQVAEEVLQTVGTSVRLPEELLDAVTAISGSGPGYIFRMAEILTRAGTFLGLSEKQSSALVRQTFLGASEMLASSQESAGELCRRVCSPGGTTLAGLDAMEKGGLEQALLAGVTAARDRARELSKG